MSDAANTFAIASTRQLRSIGLEGENLSGGIEGDRLALRGSERGEVTIAISDIVRLRAGFDDVKYGPLYQLRLWTASGGRPLALYLRKLRIGDYSAIVRTLANSVASARGMAQIERGLTAPGALFAPALFLPVVLGALAVSLFVLDEAPWWGRLAVVAIPALIFVVLLWRCFGRQYPRPVRDLAELDRYLP